MNQSWRINEWSIDRSIHIYKSKRYKDTSIAVAVAFYLLNIIDANVDAHLSQFNVNDDLTFEPVFNINPIDASANYSLSLKYRLKWK